MIRSSCPVSWKKGTEGEGPRRTVENDRWIELQEGRDTTATTTGGAHRRRTHSPGTHGWLIDQSTVEIVQQRQLRSTSLPPHHHKRINKHHLENNADNVLSTEQVKRQLLLQQAQPNRQMSRRAQLQRMQRLRRMKH